MNNTITYEKKYRIRFRYLRSGHRVTRKWYKPIMWLGNRAEHLICKLSELKSKANPYVVEPFGTWLWWIRRNITLD